MLDVQDAQDGTSKVSRPGRDGLRGPAGWDVAGRSQTVTSQQLYRQKKEEGSLNGPSVKNPCEKVLGVTYHATSGVDRIS